MTHAHEASDAALATALPARAPSSVPPTDAAPAASASVGSPWLKLSAAAAASAALAACGGGEAEAEAPQALRQADNAPHVPLLGDMGGSGSFRSDQAASRTPTPDELMDWAEMVFPQYFDSHQATITNGALVFRYYSGTRNYLGVYQGNVVVLGPPTNNAVVNVGALASFGDAVFSSGRPLNDPEAARFLLQAGFAATTQDIATVRSIGFDAWLNSQFNAPIGISGWEWLNQRGYATVDNSTASVHCLIKVSYSAKGPLTSSTTVALTCSSPATISSMAR